ncbi:MAG TPA: hypothetical protein VEX86_17000 [Longimicrobium sp.]|nr:hypothetical protein [Longimicrobium sp.]
MSDETPAGDPRDERGWAPDDGPPPPPPPPPPGSGYAYQEWPHDAPPGTGPGPAPEHGNSGAVARGVRAAAMIFGVAVALHLVTLAVVKLMGGNAAGWIFIPEGLFVVVGGFVAAIVITSKLPLDSRAPFWISGVAFMALSFIVWGATCAIAL